MRRYTPDGADIDAVIDVRAVFQQGHRALALEAMPAFLLPRKGRYGLRDYEKMFCPDLKSGRDIFDMRGIDRERGCMVVVRPDQYVAHVLPLDAHAELSAFFDGFMVTARREVCNPRRRHPGTCCRDPVCSRPLSVMRDGCRTSPGMTISSQTGTASRRRP